MQDYWWVFTLLCSMISAGMILYNQVFKLDSIIVTIYRGFGACLTLLPFMLLFKPINNFNFFLFSFIQGLVIGYFDNHVFESAKKFGAGITGLIQPLTLIFTFFIWLIISPENIDVLLASYVKTGVIIICLISISICVYFLQNNKLNKKAMIYLFPSMLCVVFLDVMGKEIMNIGAGDIASAIYYYAFTTAFGAGLANLVVFIYKKRKFKEIITKNNLIKIGVPIIFLTISTNILKMYSVFLAFNPAYVGAILYTSPLWIIIANKYILKSDSKAYADPNKWIIIAIVVAAAMLVIATR